MSDTPRAEVTIEIKVQGQTTTLSWAEPVLAEVMRAIEALGPVVNGVEISLVSARVC